MDTTSSSMGDVGVQPTHALDEQTRQKLVNDLMQARRDIAQAHRTKDPALEADARQRVHQAKIALGERGTPWWERDVPGVDPAETDGA